ncbi:Uncharacterised protein [Mycobacteroides abscessus subsp. abscessus]|nr:Uncharacterised protein [Mycobacteroides abscessus subsp. abscessus]SIC77622.1 Uncharacterised protein [Mycobacteroides abscessus subsp. abscessus]SKP27905.1 Uncharacterised protein [Mycobacteroides abscessus subsp. abscessus]
MSSSATWFILGVAAVFAAAYLGFGVFLTYEAVAHHRPSQWRHNGPPTTWDWGVRRTFWLGVALMPLMWPLVTLAFRLNSGYNRRRWNRMPLEQRRIEREQFDYEQRGRCSI